MAETENVDLRDLLNRPMSDFPDLPNLPGNKHFYGKIIGMTSGLSKQKLTPFFQFDVRLTDPGQDVTTADLKPITDAGFSLSDYNVNGQFYLTPNAMKMLRRFLTSIGFAENLNVVSALKLDADLNPTADTIDVVRGLDIMCRTAPADSEGRVYQRLDMLIGHKRT